MQWVNLNTKDLFKPERVVLSDAKKKHAFQDTFDKLNAYHKVEAKINKLEDDFKSLSKSDLDRDKGNPL